MRALPLSLVALALAACDIPQSEPMPETTPATTADVGADVPDSPAVETNAAYSDWFGRWTGPEGTSLDIQPAEEGYAITVVSLDGTETYTGRAARNGIRFMRGGVEERIRAGDGEATGMKWLLEKENCLIIKTGEGFCRD